MRNRTDFFLFFLCVRASYLVNDVYFRRKLISLSFVCIFIRERERERMTEQVWDGNPSLATNGVVAREELQLDVGSTPRVDHKQKLLTWNRRTSCLESLWRYYRGEGDWRNRICSSHLPAPRLVWSTAQTKCFRGFF